MRILPHPCRRRISRSANSDEPEYFGQLLAYLRQGDWKRSRMARRSRTRGDVMVKTRENGATENVAPVITE